MPSQYFANFPFRGYTLDPHAAIGDYVSVTDIFRRVQFRTDLLNNTRVYYPYTIQEGDTPESIAYKYYGSTDYHWVISLVNRLVHPLKQWPLSYQSFIAYIIDQYGSVETAMNMIHHYEKTITKTDSLGNSSTETTIIDQTEYDTLTSLVPEVFVFSNGATVTKETSRAAIDCYTWEDQRNEKLRTILILKFNYLQQMKKELEEFLSV